MIRKIYLLLVLFLCACSSIEDTLTLKKKPSGDEFLVEKKNPLVMPPDYGKLPKPNSEESNQDIIKDKSVNDIEQLLTNKKNMPVRNNQTKSSLEKIILENIK